MSYRNRLHIDIEQIRFSYNVQRQYAGAHPCDIRIHSARAGDYMENTMIEIRVMRFMRDWMKQKGWKPTGSVSRGITSQYFEHESDMMDWINEIPNFMMVLKLMDFNIE